VDHFPKFWPASDQKTTAAPRRNRVLTLKIKGKKGVRGRSFLLVRPQPDWKWVVGEPVSRNIIIRRKWRKKKRPHSGGQAKFVRNSFRASKWTLDTNLHRKFMTTVEGVNKRGKKIPGVSMKGVGKVAGPLRKKGHKLPKDGNLCT